MSYISNTAKTRFPWPLAFKLTMDMASYTVAFWLVVGLFAALIEWAYEVMGLPGDLLMLAVFGLICSLSGNAKALWALALPALERWLAAHRTRLGL